MEKIEQEGVEEVESTQLEDNAETHETNDSEGESPASTESTERVLSDSEYQEYRKLKRLSEKDSQKDGQEYDQKSEVSNSADVEELIFASAGITSDAAREAAKKLVKLGEAKNLMEATKDDFVQAKEQSAAADTTRQAATPPSSRRVPTQRKDTVEYWVDREGLPESQELRHKVVQERRKKRSDKNMFGTPRKVIIQ